MRGPGPGPFGVIGGLELLHVNIAETSPPFRQCKRFLL